MLFGFASTIPRSTSFFSTPRSRSPTLSPACPSSSSLRNISTPVTTTFFSVPNPTIPPSSPPLPSPPSLRLLHLPLRHRNALVQRRQELLHLPHPRLVPRNRLQRRPPDHRNVVPRILVLPQQLPPLEHP